VIVRKTRCSYLYLPDIVEYSNVTPYCSRSIWKLVTFRHHVDKRGLTLKNIKVSHLRKIARTSQIQNVHVLVYVLAVESPEDKDPTISEE
jgi:hypothetical protein